MQQTDYRKWSTVLGAFLIMLPLVYPTTWGNVSVYVYSYLWRNMGVTSGLTTPWMVSVYILSMNFSSYADAMVRKMDKRLTAALGILCYNLGIFAHYFLVQSEHALLLLLVPVVFIGFGNGLLLCVSSRFIGDWFDAKSRGIGVSIFFSGKCFGIVLTNPLLTLYVNPENISPNVELGHLKLFTDTSVINKAPSIFLVFGAMALASQVLGLSLLRQKTPGKESQESSSLTHKSPNYGSTDPALSSNVVSECQNQGTLADPCSQKCERSQYVSLTNESGSRDTIKSKLSKVLRSRELYALWVIYFCVEHIYIHQANFYKEYGQQRISNDQFLSDLTIPIGLIGGLHRIGWGFVMDRHGMKKDFIIITAAGVICVLLAYFTVMVDKWLYMISTALLYCVRASITPTFLVAASKYFDNSLYSVCYGLMTSGAIVCTLTAPPMFSFLLGTYGWFSSFAAVAVLSLIGLLTAVLALPER